MNSERHWAKIGKHPHHGISLPLSALHSKNSCGIGEFYDLLPLFPWLRSVGFDCLQLLPLNDSGDDPSPYNILSSQALNPAYITLSALPNLDRWPDLHKEMEYLQGLTKLPQVAYGEVRRRKLQWLASYFKRAVPPPAPIPPYAQFLSERDGHPPEFYAFVQQLCVQQLSHVKAMADQAGILLIGDLPLLVNSHSVDRWEEPSLFLSGTKVGAPPDIYNTQGQDWGLPAYNIRRLRETHFAWWRRRLATIERFFHIYRIDHVVGLFRLWIIPEGGLPKDGAFVPRDFQEQIEQGREFLEMMLQSTELLPIAEDLGVIPDEVEQILHEMQICGMRILQFYFHQPEATPLRLVSLSTHDTPPFALWWRNYPQEATPFAQARGWHYQPQFSNQQRLAVLREAHQAKGIFHINLLQEYLALFPELCHAHIEEERINVPGQLVASNWTYRYRPSIEELVAHKKLTALLRLLII